MGVLLLMGILLQFKREMGIICIVSVVRVRISSIQQIGEFITAGSCSNGTITLFLRPSLLCCYASCKPD
jgi:hypothetical protein